MSEDLSVMRPLLLPGLSGQLWSGSGCHVTPGFYGLGSGQWPGQ